MVEAEVQFHLDRFKATGAELVRGEARFVASKTVEVHLNDGACGQLQVIGCFWTWDRRLPSRRSRALGLHNP